MKERLSESVIRRFMKLAGTSPLSSEFLKEGGMSYARDDEEGEELAAEEPAEELAAEEPVEDAADLALEPEPVEAEGAEEDLRDILAKEIEDMLGRLEDQGVIEITGEADVEEPAAEEPPMEELPAEEPAEGEEELPAEEPVEGEEEVELALQEANIDYIDDEAIANKLLKRVAARLYKENKIDRLAARIANKLSEKK